ncbi:helix-turn-helix domain-containing protein [Cupriavidus gilardii]|uniref:helix-turn-helix domain-containing protein n=1 Tax=Cupriavidus gilardii TaxID=82541 RepID=UPI001580E292|nr:helix-turn-helix transcriptional regulator [Cupriavidus gilardii]QKS60867.1 helix-turn-helix transcriptional regulator [Cupriavidus gilardii]
MNASLTAIYPSAYIPGMGIADRIDRMMRERKFKSQSALSRASGVPQPTIARILAGRNTPETSTVLKIAAALGVTSTWLLDGPDESPEYAGSRKSGTPEEAERARGTLRSAQIDRAVQLLEDMDDADLSRALAMLQDFSAVPSPAIEIKQGAGGRRTTSDTKRTGTTE